MMRLWRDDREGHLEEDKGRFGQTGRHRFLYKPGKNASASEPDPGVALVESETVAESSPEHETMQVMAKQCISTERKFRARTSPP